MPQDNLFEQPTPSTEAEGRNIPKGQPSVPQPQEPTVESPLGEPSPVPEQAAQLRQEEEPVQEEPTQEQVQQPVEQQQGEVPQEEQQPQYDFPVPVNPSRYYDVNGFNTDISGASRRINNKLLDRQQQLDVNTLISNTQATPYGLPENLQLPDITPDVEGSIDRVNNMRQEAYDNIDKYNFRRDYGIEFNNAVIHPDGTVTPKTPTISLDTSQNGVKSDMGQSVEETGNTGLLGRMLNNPIGNYIMDSGDYSGLVETINQFDPNSRKLGDMDIGLGTAVGLGLKVLNTVESVLVGAVYDIADNTVMRLHNNGRDPHEGVRAWQALVEGRDWGVSNRWTPEKYLSWNEPEGIKAGDIIDDEFWSKEENKNIPEWMRRNKENYWNLPEKLSEAVGKDDTSTMSRSLHWILQGIPSYGFEVFTGGLADAVVGKGLKVFGNIGEEALQRTDKLLKDVNLDQVVDGIDETARLVPSTPHKLLPPAKDLDPGDVIITNKNKMNYTSPDGRYTIEVPVESVGKEYPIEPEVVTIYPRDYVTKLPDQSKLTTSDILNPNLVIEPSTRDIEDLTELGKRTPFVDGTPLIPPNTTRLLTPTEVGALRSMDSGDIMGEFGIKVNPQVSQADFISMPDGSVVRTPRYSKLIPENQSDEVVGITNENAVKAYEELTENIRHSEDFSETAVYSGKRNVALAKMADDGVAYDVVKKEFPVELQSDSPVSAQEGNFIIQNQIELSGESAEASRLLEEQRKITSVVHELKQKLEVYPLYRGDLHVEKTTREASTGIIDDTLSIQDEVVPVPLSRNTQLNQELLAHQNPEEVAQGLRQPPERNLSDLLEEKESLRPKENPPVFEELTHKDTLVFSNYVRQRAISENQVNSKIPDLLEQYRQDWEAGGRKGFNTTREAQSNPYTPYVKLKESQIKGFDIDVARQSLIDDGVDTSGMDDRTVATLASYHNLYPDHDLNKIRLYDSIGDVPTEITEQQLRSIQQPKQVTGEDEFLSQLQGEVKLRSKNNQNLNGLPELEHTVDWVQKDWKHGTSYTGDIRSVNPLEGASTSEFGLGVYLTQTNDVAESASRMGDFPSKPFNVNFKSDHTNPRVHNVDVSSLSNVLKGDDSMGKPIRQQWHVASTQAMNKNNLGKTKVKLPQGTKLEDMFNTWKISYYEQFGEVPSELVVRDFQENLTRRISDLGYEGMYVNKNGVETLVVYKPNQLDVISTTPVKRSNTLEETLEAKRYLEGVTAKQLGDEVSIANYTKSQKEFADYKLQTVTEQYLQKEQSMMEKVDNIFDSTKKITDETQANKLADEQYVTTELAETTAKQNERLTDIQRSPC